MRRFVSLVVVVMMIVTSVPSSLFAAAQTVNHQGGTLTGIARSADNAPVPNYTGHARKVDDGVLVASTTTNGAGEFRFAGLAPGN